MEFTIKKADKSQLKDIMSVMENAEQSVEKKEWFVTDDEVYMEEVLSGKGFIIGAWEKATEELAGFFAVVFPDKEDNMGKYAELSGEELAKVVYMDSAAVKDKFRGNRLQQKMLMAAEEELEKIQKETGADCQYRMCSVHPDNCYSLQNMRKNGYEIVARTELYGGLDRYVLCKKVKNRN